MTRYLPEGELLNRESVQVYTASEVALQNACRDKVILEAVATLCDSEHNLHVDLGCMKGIIPRDEGALGIKDGVVRDIALISRVNKPVQFVVTGFESDEKGNTRAVLSRRLAQQWCWEDYCSTLVAGDIVPVTITHLEKFGAFVDIGCGVNSLIPIDMLSVSRISHPSQRVSVGEKLQAVVRNTLGGKITLSLRELLGTWWENAEKFNVGETVTGVVRSVEDYGIFVELTPNLAGLCEPTEGVLAGDTVTVYIKAIIPEKMKVKLTIIDRFSTLNTTTCKEYFVSADHLDYWRYSPEECPRVIETNFS